MFGLRRKIAPAKPAIAAASWTDDDGKVTSLEFDPPRTSIWHALLDLSEKRRSRPS